MRQTWLYVPPKRAFDIQSDSVGAPPLAHDDRDERGRQNKFPSSTLQFRQAACLDHLWRALLNTPRRLRSRLRRCNTSSLSAPALPLLPVAPDLRRLSRQLNQRQPPRSPDLLRVGEIEGAHARHDTTTSRSAKDPSPRSPWIRRLRNLPEQPVRKRIGPESRYH